MLALLVAAQGARAQSPAEIYGNLNLTLTRDSGLASPSSPNPEDSRNVFEFSLRTTQVGVRWAPTPLEDWLAGGRLEFDFQGGANTTLQPRVRHAYFSIAKGNFEFLAGQTWDVIAPLRADSITFPAESWPGDIGQRRPLASGSLRTALGDKMSLLLVLAAAQFTQGLVDPASGQVVETTHVPALMGRVTLDLPVAGEMAQVSMWGHSGYKGYSAHGGIPAGAIQTSSLGVSLVAPMGPRWSFQSEIWEGRVGDASHPEELSRGAMNLTDVIQSRGGWGQLAFRPWPEWRFNVGMGRQYPRVLRAAEQGAQRISSWYANGYRTLAKRFEVGLECSDWDSRFPGTSNSNKTLRSQLSLTYRF